MIYAGDNDGWLPTGDDFSLLREQEYLVAEKVYQCPSSRRNRNGSDGEFVDDYIYLGAGSRLYNGEDQGGDVAGLTDNVIIAHEGMNNHRQQRAVNCLLADGSVHSLKVRQKETFREAVQRSGCMLARELDPHRVTSY